MARKLSLPLALIAGVGAGVAQPIQFMMAGDIEGGLNRLTKNYTGYNPRDGSFDIMNLTGGLVPLILGALVHKYVGGYPLNVNRALANAGVPILRI